MLYNVRIIAVIIIFMIIPIISSANSRYFLIGVDVSGSYDLKSNSLKMVETFILNEMQPGDTLIARKISAKSYLDTPDNMLLPSALVLPETGDKPENRFNVSALKKYKKRQRETIQLKISAIKYMRNLKPAKAKMTDIYGFLASCSDRLALVDDQIKKTVIIASDMQDNCNRKSDINLAGANIVVVAFETTADPVKTKKMRNTWAQWLQKMNSGDVYFLSPDQQISKFL